LTKATTFLTDMGFSIDVGSPKLSVRDRSGVFGWLHYFAAFSPGFVRSAINFLRLENNSLILDPFVGSGTTCIVSKCANIPSVGLELNPVGYFVSRAKLNWNLERTSLLTILKELKNLPDQNVKPTPEYGKWFVNEDATIERSLSLGTYILHSIPKEMVDFFITALLLSLRKIATSECELNPTWTPQKHKLPKLDANSFFHVFSTQAQRMLRDLEKLKASYVESKVDPDVFYGDALKFEYPRQFDAIITSPPYLSRIDYIISFRLENEFLENLGALPGLNVKKLRDRMIGTVTVTDRSPPNLEWGQTCFEILHHIRTHPSKASRTYYYPTIMKYFKDIFKWFTEARKLLKPKGSIVLVVQSSYFKEIEIPVSSIFIEMCQNVGFDSTSIIHRENVKFHRGLMDPEQRKYAPGKVLHEDVIWIR